MNITKRSQIEELAQQNGLSVEYDPISPTGITVEEQLVVNAPLYPFVGNKALKRSVEVIELELPKLRQIQGIRNLKIKQGE